CSSQDETMITVQGPDINVENTLNPLCSYSSDGEVMLSGQGLFSPFAYSVDNVEFSLDSTFSNLEAGIYTFYIQDNTGCTTQTELVLDSPDELDIVSVTTGDDGSSNGQVEMVVLGGTAPYEISFDGSAFSGSILYTNLSAGEYVILVMDTNGCTTETTIEIDLIDAISESDIDFTLHFFPNPATDQIQLETSSNVEHLIVRDATGKVVLEFGQLGRNPMIELGALSSGTYMIEVNRQFRKILLVK
ncbi:MAG: T9SS type A sorting domain-containing protein, partial [Bacteroidota bacterium]